MTPRPPWYAVLIAAVCASGVVTSFAVGHIDTQWVAWIGLFLTMEVVGAVSKTPGLTLSERVWCWIGVRPVRPARFVRAPAFGIFLLELGGHFVTGAALPITSGWAVGITAVPVAVIIVQAWLFEKETA